MVLSLHRPLHTLQEEERGHDKEQRATRAGEEAALMDEGQISFFLFQQLMLEQRSTSAWASMVRWEYCCQVNAVLAYLIYSAVSVVLI